MALDFKEGSVVNRNGVGFPRYRIVFLGKVGISACRMRLDIFSQWVSTQAEFLCSSDSAFSMGMPMGRTTSNPFSLILMWYLVARFETRTE
jgi:hypothetical protein